MNLPRSNADDAAPAAERSRDGSLQSVLGASVDYSHLSIQGYPAGNGSPIDGRVSPTASVETEYGWEWKTSLLAPVIIALGEEHRQDARATGQWEHVAIGAALAGVSVACHANVWRADRQLRLDSQGRIEAAPALDGIVEAFNRYDRGQGELLVQVGDEDVRLGMPEYLARKHRLQTIELTWGQGAADHGDPLRIESLQRALDCQRQGYTIVPDPSDPIVQECFEDGLIEHFERHGRLGLRDEASFLAGCERLRALGFRRIALRTAVAGLRELAMILKWSSRSRIDLLTLDGRLGENAGTGPAFSQSPDLHLHAAAAQFATRLAGKGQRVPDLALAGGFRDEEQLFKALALGGPFVKAAQVDEIGTGVAPAFSRFGRQMEEVFGCWEQVAEVVGKREMSNVPMAAVGVFARVQRLADGLRQIVAGARCFNLATVGRKDLTSLTRQCAEVTGIPCAVDAYRAEAEAILDH